MEKVLCVCLGNCSRSPMMQVILQQHLGPAFDVESAGVRQEAAGLAANGKYRRRGDPPRRWRRLPINLSLDGEIEGQGYEEIDSYAAREAATA